MQAVFSIRVKLYSSRAIGRTIFTERLKERCLADVGKESHFVH